jgi:hypothetical protein
MGTQTGEKDIGNNKAQENVFNFQPASHLIPEAVEIPVVVQNPLKIRTLIFLQMENIPESCYAYFPHQVVTGSLWESVSSSFFLYLFGRSPT